jgi:hypothetical protein
MQDHCAKKAVESYIFLSDPDPWIRNPIFTGLDLDWEDQFNYLCTHDLYDLVRNVFDTGRYIMWACGRGLGPGNRKFFGPCEMASSR